MLKTAAALIELALTPEPPVPTSQEIELHRLRRENARLKSALAPMLAHAEAHDYAPPIRLSVRQCRDIKEKP